MTEDEAKFKSDSQTDEQKLWMNTATCKRRKYKTYNINPNTRMENLKNILLMSEEAI